MAVLVALAGAGVGSIFGMPNLGWAIGSIIGQEFFPSGQSTTGPRLQDLSVQSSAWGMAIPFGDGTVRIAGNVVWSPGIHEQENVESIGGKGGLLPSGPTATTFTYSISARISFSEPAKDIIRLWADKKLIFDKTAKGHRAMDGLRFRFHSGAEDQLPDSLEESDPRIEAGLCPAYRGQCGITIEDFPLERFGNHFPSFEAEVAFRSQSSTLYTHATGLAGGMTTTQTGSLAADLDRGVFYTARGTSPNGMGVYDYDTVVERRQQFTLDMGAPGSETNFQTSSLHVVGPDGLIYGTGGPSNTSPIICLDPASLRETGRFGKNGIFLLGILTPASGDPRINLPTAFGFVTNYDAVSGTRQDYVVATQFGGGQIGVFRSRTVEYVGMATIVAGNFNRIFQRLTAKGLGDCYLGSSDGQILRLSVSSDAHYSLPAGPTPEQQFGVTLVDLGEVDPTQIDPTATSFAATTVQWAGYDSSDDSLIATGRLADGGGGDYLFKWREGTGVVWKTKVAIVLDGTQPNSRIGGGIFAYQSGSTVAAVDTVTGAVEYLTVTSVTGANGSQIYDYRSDSITLFDTGVSTWTREWLHRGAGLATTVEDIIRNVCGRVGFTNADLDTSAVSAIPVAGYIIGRPVTAKDALAPLNQAYFVDACESDGKLKFVVRGGSSIATIPQRDLGWVDENKGESAQEKITADIELPASSTVTFIDQSKDYEQNSKTKNRTRLPLPTMRASGNLAVQLPIVLGDPDEALQIAEKWLYAAYFERSTYPLQLPWTYLWMDPTDVATVNLDDGTSFVCKFNRVDIGLDLQLAIEAISQDAIAYTSTASAGTDLGITQTVKQAGITELMVLDVPLLRDIDDGGGSASIVYLVASSFNNSSWPGCQVFESSTASANGAQVKTMTSPATWGTTGSALPDNPQPWAWDTTTALKVYLVNQGAREISSSTDEQVFAGANPVAIVRADGYAEIIQFVNATLEDDGSYTLTRLLRGRRGTDVYCGGHAIGDRFILLGEPEVKTIATPTADSGLLRYWRGVGFGTLVENASLVVKATHALDLRPYAPAMAAAASTGGGSPDIDLTWARRNRLHANLFNLPAGVVPLSEASEAYEVEILDAPGGTVLRTLTGLSSPAATYANADIVSDFGSVPDELTLKLYQMSAIVGRGLSREITVGVS